jgi:hypothetical protein
MIEAKKLFILLGANTIVDQNKLVIVFNQQGSHSPGAEIVFIGWIGSLPDGLWNDTEHGASVKLKKTSIDCVQLHSLLIDSKFRIRGQESNFTYRFIKNKKAVQHSLSNLFIRK